MLAHWDHSSGVYFLISWMTATKSPARSLTVVIWPLGYAQIVLPDHQQQRGLYASTQPPVLRESLFPLYR